MLLLIFSNCYGTLVWTGPSPSRVARVEPEDRIIRISAG